MSAPDDDRDGLTDAYRQASAADAGRPSAATRAAILAAAREAAAQRRPAANDSPFSWRMAAGLAVVGIALIVWRQLPRDVAPLQSVPTVMVADEPRPDAAESDAASESAPAAPAAEPMREEARASALAKAETPPAPAAAPAPPPVVVELQARQAVPESRDAALRQSFNAASARNATNVDGLVRREFPALLDDATPPAGVWIVQDAGGRTLRTGTLAAGETLGSVWTRLQREMPDRRLRPFQMSTVRGARGADVLVGLSRAE